MKNDEDLAEHYFGKVVSDVISMLAPYRNNIEVMRKMNAVLPAYIQGYLSTFPPSQAQIPRQKTKTEIIEFKPRKG